jgi:TPR repeat protein
MRDNDALAALRVRATAGDVDAQSDLGVMYQRGLDVPQDYAQAASWLRNAAEQGDPKAQRRLGSMYRDGKGVPQDYAQAVAWFHKAADQGLAGAQYSLGYAYEAGQGVPQDYVEAHKWRNLAASRASVANQKQYVKTRNALAKKMPPAQIADAQQLAREWLAAFEQRASEQLAELAGGV